MWDGVNPTQVVTIQSITFLERYNEYLEQAHADAHSEAKIIIALWSSSAMMKQDQPFEQEDGQCSNLLLLQWKCSKILRVSFLFSVKVVRQEDKLSFVVIKV